MRRMTKEINYCLWSTGELEGGRLGGNCHKNSVSFWSSQLQSFSSQAQALKVLYVSFLLIRTEWFIKSYSL